MSLCIIRLVHILIPLMTMHQLDRNDNFTCRSIFALGENYNTHTRIIIMHAHALQPRDISVGTGSPLHYNYCPAPAKSKATMTEPMSLVKRPTCQTKP